MSNKRRLDALLVERGLAESRARAQALVLAGLVWSGERRLDKPGVGLAADTPLELRGREHPWVSRGGIKLAHGLDHFALAADDAVALDIGASTGGFTDVLLARGARRVYAVDVGHGQLAWKLRQDPRVVVLERRNARHLTRDDIPEPPDLIVCDASFISLTAVLPAALALAAPEARLVALIKPQFEVGKGRVGKGGVVRDPALHREVCERIAAWLSAQPGWEVVGLTESPIRGPEGNVEFLIQARRRGA
ncbi:MAG TPA: TlyA family RNA methyltransferase [Stellaceae bacterium]|nr:TlyA family RNA methyltransferase [Stellaceae bacterium]